MPIPRFRIAVKNDKLHDDIVMFRAYPMNYVIVFLHSEKLIFKQSCC